jgi:hypothetical protein
MKTATTAERSTAAPAIRSRPATVRSDRLATTATTTATPRATSVLREKPRNEITMTGTR